MRGEDDLAGGGAAAFEALDGQGDRVRGLLAGVLADRGQVHVGEPGQHAVVVADDRDRSGNGHTLAGEHTVGGVNIRVTIIYWIVIVAIATWILLRTRIGNWIFSVGGSAPSARAVGVPAGKVKIGLFMAVGLLAWFTGMHTLFEFNTIQSGQGVGNEFVYIISAPLGSARLRVRRRCGRGPPAGRAVRRAGRGRRVLALGADRHGRAAPFRRKRPLHRQAGEPVTTQEPFEVLTMGRIGVDIYPLQTGRSLRHVETFGKYLGGSATNVAVAAARYGRRAAVISRTGQDPFGDYIHDALRGFGVDDRFVTAVPSLPTPVTFCEIFPPDDFPLYFYRFPTAPDLQIERSELDLGAIEAAGIFWMTGTGLCQEPSRSATLRALEARNRSRPGGPTVFDLDYRAMFWPSREEARRWYQEALPHATVAVGNLDECDTAVGVREPRAAAQALHDAGIQLAIIKQGPAGVLASDGTQIVQVPPVPVEVVNGLGAGDAFGGALCHALVSGWDLERTLRFCNAAGAVVASRLACADAMPTADEVEATMREADLLNKGTQRA